MFLTSTASSAWSTSLPHARGGVSDAALRVPDGGLSSPRTWGCFLMPHTMPVFPTHVGVFLPWGCLFARCCGLPHARGGVSKRVIAKHGLIRSSPRTWGCFHRARPRHARQGVFPTHVGVFLVGTHSLPAALGLPHARGGVSQAQRLCAAHRVSSPRTWGCFQPSDTAPVPVAVFPTHVGVFPKMAASGWHP